MVECWRPASACPSRKPCPAWFAQVAFSSWSDGSDFVFGTPMIQMDSYRLHGGGRQIRFEHARNTLGEAVNPVLAAINLNLQIIWMAVTDGPIGVNDLPEYAGVFQQNQLNSSAGCREWKLPATGILELLHAFHAVSLGIQGQDTAPVLRQSLEPKLSLFRDLEGGITLCAVEHGPLIIWDMVQECVQIGSNPWHLRLQIDLDFERFRSRSPSCLHSSRQDLTSQKVDDHRSFASRHPAKEWSTIGNFSKNDGGVSPFCRPLQSL